MDTPSAEKFNERTYPLVVHLVRQDRAGRLAVVAILFKLGKENSTLKQVFDALPAAEGEKHALSGPIDLTAALPKQRSIYAYIGSLTTPPCTEGAVESIEAAERNIESTAGIVPKAVFDECPSGTATQR